MSYYFSMAGIGILIGKVIIDLMASVQSLSGLPFIGDLAKLGILYPLAITLIAWDKIGLILSLIAFAFISLLLIMAGAPLL